MCFRRHLPSNLGAGLSVWAREVGEGKGRCLFIQLHTVVAFWVSWLLFYLIFYDFDEDSGSPNMSVDKGLMLKL